MDYGKIENEWSVAREEAANKQEAAMLERDGFLPIGPTPEKPGDGYARRYDVSLDGKSIVVSWEIPPPPPRTISKFKLKLAIAQAGLLQQFTALLSQVEVAPGYWGDEAFADAVTLDEDNEKFKDAVKAVKQQFGMTDEEVERILAASVAD